MDKAFRIQSRARIPIIMGSLTAFALVAPGTLLARPGTPNNERAWACNRPLAEPPAVCAVFNNTATEEVTFDIEFTVNGTKVVDNRPKADCVRTSRNAKNSPCFGAGCQPQKDLPDYYCEAASSFNLDYQHATRARGKTGSHNANGDPIPQQGLKIAKLDYDSTYCFRMKARRVSDSLVSELWSNWACAKTAAAPPPKPSKPDVTVEYVPGGKDWRVKPPTVTINWGPASNAAEYRVYRKTPGDYYSQDVKTVKPGTAVDVLKEADVARNERSPSILYSVCASNITGATCTEKSSYVALPGTVEKPERPLDVTVPPKTQADSARNVPGIGVTKPGESTASERAVPRPRRPMSDVLQK